jgi:small subunit ribosomal protein S19
VGRSLKKGPYVDEKLLTKVLKQKDSGDREPIKTWARACTIVPDFVGHTFMVHNGRKFEKVFVTEDMVGHRLGEFALTRTFRGHGVAGSKAAKEAEAAEQASS